MMIITFSAQPPVEQPQTIIPAVKVHKSPGYVAYLENTCSHKFSKETKQEENEADVFVLTLIKGDVEMFSLIFE